MKLQVGDSVVSGTGDVEPAIDGLSPACTAAVASSAASNTLASM
jgi:hypothetical protein